MVGENRYETRYVIWDLPRVVAIGLGIAVAAIALAVVWMAGESHYRSCVAKAEAEFPAAPVSAFADGTSDVGPLKLSFVEERAAAVDDCPRFF